jgi:hypothetical protein
MPKIDLTPTSHLISLNESAKFLFEKSVRISLKWINGFEEFDLCIFYMTKEGKTGGIFPSEYHGCKDNIGKLDKFPFMIIIQDESLEEDVMDEIMISDISNMEVLYLTLVDYNAAIYQTPVNFNDYNISLELVTDTGDKKVISEINSSSKGLVYLFGRIYHENDSFILTNDGLILNLEKAVNEIPGFISMTTTAL